MQGNLFKKSAVLIEQNAIESRLYSDILSANGFDVYVAKSPMDALVRLRNKNNDLVLLDTSIAGIAFINKYIKNIRREKNCELTSIVGLTAFSKDDQKNQPDGLDTCLTKPCSIDTLLEVIFSSIEKKVHGCKYSDDRL